MTPNTWQHVVATWTGSPDAAEAAIYVNANLPVFDQATDGTGARRSDTGRDLTLGSKSSLDGGHDGVLDEIRISSVARSPDWIRAEYKSETDDFIAFEPEQPIACDVTDR